MRMPVTMLYDFVVQKFQLGEKADDVRQLNEVNEPTDWSVAVWWINIQVTSMTFK